MGFGCQKDKDCGNDVFSRDGASRAVRRAKKMEMRYVWLIEHEIVSEKMIVGVIGTLMVAPGKMLMLVVEKT
ncbi:hypothetical protein DPMN_174048 [Dreissena polymorpha]|uniref:Uncharacterized protein n=1 Tax=Dreissena polymorpha TaxID=45954 RepID=A0A9D4E5C1_DREPO|nr:hypothetical protein DPMN_174048 [Dreissena polymorpha]